MFFTKPKKAKKNTRQHAINMTILNQVRRNKSVIHGQKAVNEHLPKHLEKETRDWDIYSKSPKRRARELENALDKLFKKDLFQVKSAKHKRTFKVIDKATGKTIADFTSPIGEISHKTSLDGIKFARIAYLKKKLLKMLRKKELEFRWPKSKEALKKIEKFGG